MIIGYERQIAMLAAHCTRGAVSHAYIFSGPAHIGKGTIARAFAQRLLCHKSNARAMDLAACGICVSCIAYMHNAHPDMYTIAPSVAKEGSAARIGISAMRALKDRASRSALLGGRKIYVIEHAPAMTREAANSFLKVLEEPSQDSVFILIAHSPEDVLPTVASRSWRVRFWPLSIERMERELLSHGADVTQASQAAFLSFGRAGIALAKVAEPVQALNAEMYRLERAVYARMASPLYERFSYAEALAEDTLKEDSWYTEAIALLQLAIHRELGLASTVAVPIHIQAELYAVAHTVRAFITGHMQAQYPYTNTRLQWDAAFAQAYQSV